MGLMLICRRQTKEWLPRSSHLPRARTKEDVSLIEQSVARSGQETTTEPPPAYVLRGLGLYELHAEDILAAYQGAGRWLVPSGTTPGIVYEVRVGRRPGRDRCECTGYQHHGHCSHHVAAERVAKKSAVCDSCGQRRWWSELVEVHEEDGISWHPGDRLCRSCIRAGAWL